MAWWKPRSAGVARITRGKQAERLARAFLQAQGFEVIERNVRFPVGEIDLVAQEGQALCFVEVRSTSSQQWGGALASVTDRKRQRLLKAARWYLRYHPVNFPEIRFDVVAIDWRSQEKPGIELIRGAFSSD